MKSYYSIVRISPNSAAKDRISIGILAGQEEALWLKISERKLRWVRQMVSSSKVLDFTLKQLEAYVEEYHIKVKESKKELFDYNQPLKADDLDYLNRYSNGMLQFSAPSLLNDRLDETKIEKLFHLLVDDQVDERVILKENEDRIQSVIHKELIEKIEGQIHTHIQLTRKQIPNLFFNYKMDCLGKNGLYIGAKSIPFTQTKQTIDKNVSYYMSLITLLKHDVHKIEDNFYLIADEPEKTESSKHRIWRDVRENPLFKTIPAEESGLIAEKIRETGATTFLEE